ncbi:MAG: hypothetical protein E7040_06990 [Lentisphaerae bacterium]|nr:hypothetical protein [Lentisphaerota bacterium]
MDPRTGKPARYAGDYLEKPHVSVPKRSVFSRKMFRGVWVATVENIDFSKHQSIDSFKKEFITVVNNLKSIHATAVIFQIRPMNDAFYPSKLNPYSKFMTGTEGAGFRNFDPLKFMIAECHKQGIEFHAWLNPYRVLHHVKVSKEQALQGLSRKNFARLHPELVLNVPGNDGNRLLILDPGRPEVRAFLLATVREIIVNYNVDAIHFDDYFYPYEGTDNADLATYKRYNPRQLSLENWRRNNVDIMVYSVSKLIRSVNRAQRRNIQFGISPFGIWGNKKHIQYGSLTGGSESYFKQYADTRRWVRSGWLDYIAPQLYWSFGHNTAAYAHLADWWAGTVRGTKTKLYIGHSIARIGTNREWSNPNEVYNQLRYNTMVPGIKGSILYSYSKIFRPINPAMKTGSKKVTDLWKKF